MEGYRDWRFLFFLAIIRTSVLGRFYLSGDKLIGLL
jgi:hypothetical protein